MTTPREPDSILAAWLEEGPNELPESTRRAIAVATRTTTQHQRPMWTPWRTQLMNPFSKVALAALAIVAIVGGGVYFLSPGGQVGGPSPAPPPSSAPASSTPPSPAPQGAVPTEWATYPSFRFGYSIDYPAAWGVTPATSDWIFGGLHPEGSNLDRFGLTPTGTRVLVSSTPNTAEQSSADRIAELDAINVACRLSDRHEITLDGVTARQEDFFCFGVDYGIEVVVANETRHFQIDLFSQTPIGETDRATFERFLSSFRFGTTTAFTSTRYGFTVEYPSELVAKPSQGDWTYPNLFEPHDPNFDGFTSVSSMPSLGQAWLGIASMPLPDGMTGDDWMIWYEERNEALYGAVCPQVDGGAWKPTTVAGAAGRSSEADCGYEVTVTEIVFTDAGRGWMISGDTPLVDAMLPSFQLPG